MWIIRSFLLSSCNYPYNWRICRKRHWTSKQVRSTFINFFKEDDHKYIRSSSVLPWKDQSIPFVNAGMIQFKPILLGHKTPAHPRVVNSQKCVRLGGKHNDLMVVGTDTYHHTFFEMLGSWSFGDYFKTKSCCLAWTLMTEVFKLPRERLYVTYFGGDKSLNLPPDEEMLHIWSSLGIPKSHIIPFGIEDNFWEMGPIGPCGPCTEIHYDRIGRSDANLQVNKGIEDVIELWNIVFIQYERYRDGSLTPLDMHSVDTGMGLERLTATLNGSKSNYDSDLFTPLFHKIQKLSNSVPYSGVFDGVAGERDTAYRVIADHSRLLAVTLADGIIASDNPKWKRILHRTLSLGETHFGLTSWPWLQEMMYTVAETVGDVYPELWGKMQHSTDTLREQVELIKQESSSVDKHWKNLVRQHSCLKCFEKDRSKALINVVEPMLGKMEDWRRNGGTIPITDAVDIISYIQNDVNLFEELANSLGVYVNVDELEEAIEHVTHSQKLNTQDDLNKLDQDSTNKLILSHLINNRTAVTDNSSKYSYYVDNSTNEYVYPPCHTQIVGIFNKSSDSLLTATKGDCVGIVTKSSNFYFESGGQEGDEGVISSNTGGEIKITHADEVEGYVIHWGHVEEGEVRVGDDVVCNINEEKRISCSRHHTAIHLLNNAIKTRNVAVSQVSSQAAPEFFELTVHINKTLNSQDIDNFEKIIKDWIKTKHLIHRRIVELDDALRQDISFLPGFVYPSNVSLVSVRGEEERHEAVHLNSNELCCGTHLINTQHLHNIVITSFKQRANKLATFRGICGPQVDVILQLQEEMIKNLPEIEKSVLEMSFDVDKYNSLIEQVERISQSTLSYSTQNKYGGEISVLLKKLYKNRDDISQRQELESAMRESEDGLVIKIFTSEKKRVELDRLARVCKSHPTLLFDIHDNNCLFGRIVLPKVLVKQGLSASTWVERIAPLFDGYRGKEKTQVKQTNFACVKVFNKTELEELLPEIRRRSLDYLKAHIKDKTFT